MPGLGRGMKGTFEQLFFLTKLGGGTGLAYLEIYIRQLTTAHPEDSVCLKHSIHGNSLARCPSPSFASSSKARRGRMWTDGSQGAKPKSVERMWYLSIHHRIVYEWQMYRCWQDVLWSRKRRNTFQSVVIWNNGHSTVCMMRWVENGPTLFLCFNVQLPASILWFWCWGLFFFSRFLGTVEELAWSESPAHLLSFTFVAKPWLMTGGFFLFSADMRLRFGLTCLSLMTRTSQTCVPSTNYLALVFNWARFMIHANVGNAKLNVYWR